MRVAIFSDVHGNLEALIAVLEKIAAMDVARIICLGDVVGYGADPDECIDHIQASVDAVLAGNHDWAAVGLSDMENFNPIAHTAIRWTIRHMSLAHAAYLRTCPLSIDEGDVRYAHATPETPWSWNYLFHPDDGREELKRTRARVCFVGHSHRAFICSDVRQPDVRVEGAASMAPSGRYLVNVGSVGQPRDGDPRAAFAIWNRENGNLALHRVSYDISTAQAKIRAAGLPAFLAERLALGM